MGDYYFFGFSQFVGSSHWLNFDKFCDTAPLYESTLLLSEPVFFFCRENLENDTEFEVEGDIPTPGPQTSEPGPSTQADEKAESGELSFFYLVQLHGIIKTM